MNVDRLSSRTEKGGDRSETLAQEPSAAECRMANGVPGSAVLTQEPFAADALAPLTARVKSEGGGA